MRLLQFLLLSQSVIHVYSALTYIDVTLCRSIKDGGYYPVPCCNINGRDIWFKDNCNIMKDIEIQNQAVYSLLVKISEKLNITVNNTSPIFIYSLGNSVYPCWMTILGLCFLMSLLNDYLK